MNKTALRKLLAVLVICAPVAAAQDSFPESALLTLNYDSVLNPRGATGGVAPLAFKQDNRQSFAADDKAPQPPTPRQGDWLVGGFDTSSRWLSAAIGIGLAAYLSSADTDDIRDLGDVTQLLPGAFALGANLAIGDRAGLKQFGYVAGTTLVTTHGLKQIVDKTRPDDSQDNSFPSGHTSASVMGAAYVWQRYGAKWGAPASLVAAYTGVSRVRGQKHFADDVISGAALGLISNWLWTDPIDERVRISLFPTDGGAELRFEYDPSVSPAIGRSDATEILPSHYFLWEIGVADVTRNRVSSLDPAGSPIDWRFDQENNPTTTALVSIGWALSPASRHGVYLAASPFEVRESLDAPYDIDFATQAFPAGSTLRSRYVANDIRVGYAYDVFDSERQEWTLGASLAVFDTVLELQSGDTTARIGNTLVRPVLGVQYESAPYGRVYIRAAYNAWRDSEVSLTDFTAQVAYRIDSSWALSLGYRYVDREIRSNELTNDVSQNQVALGVLYFW